MSTKIIRICLAHGTRLEINQFNGHGCPCCHARTKLTCGCAFIGGVEITRNVNASRYVEYNSEYTAPQPPVVVDNEFRQIIDAWVMSAIDDNDDQKIAMLQDCDNEAKANNVQVYDVILRRLMQCPPQPAHKSDCHNCPSCRLAEWHRRHVSEVL